MIYHENSITTFPLVIYSIEQPYIEKEKESASSMSYVIFYCHYDERLDCVLFNWIGGSFS